MHTATEKWQEPLDLERCNGVKVLGAGWYTLFEAQYQGVAFSWEAIVQSKGQIRSVRVLPILIPQDVEVPKGTSVTQAIGFAGPARCSVALIYEKRPWPALVQDAPGDTLLEMPGGILEIGDSSVSVAAMREFLEELGAHGGGAILATDSLLKEPSPADAGGHIEGHSLIAIAYRGPNEFRVAEGHKDPIEKYELLSLPTAYRLLLGRHERREQCVDLKTLAALLMLERAYYETRGEMFGS